MSTQIPTAKEAREILGRFNASHFNNTGEEHARYSIPARPDHDDDLRLAAFIQHAEETAGQLEELRDSLKDGLGQAVIKWMDRCASLKESFANPENCQTISVPKQFIPDGATLVECYEKNGEFIIVGEPSPCEDEESFDYHNCDAMGCSTFSHVVARVPATINARVWKLEYVVKAHVKDLGQCAALFESDDGVSRIFGKTAGGMREAASGLEAALIFPPETTPEEQTHA